MQTITTKYHGHTNKRGSRISATSASGLRVYVQIDNGLQDHQNHEAALRKLCRKYDWPGQYVCGETADGARIWVAVPRNVVLAYHDGLRLQPCQPGQYCDWLAVNGTTNA
jgi:hypothetical protein